MEKEKISTFQPISPDEVDRIKQQQGDAIAKIIEKSPQNQQGGGEQPEEKPRGGAFKGKGGDDYRGQIFQLMTLIQIINSNLLTRKKNRDK